MLSLLLAASLIASKPAAGYTIKLHDMKDFIQFAENVKNGVMYYNMTLALESDLDFSDPIAQGFEPIGPDSDYYFPGTFNGQGHTISNLNIITDNQYTGLFGYGSGTVVGNIIIDSSCSFTNTCNDTINMYIGGIIGKCGSSTRPCIIENSVNMADITCNISTKNYGSYIGGVIGSSAGYRDDYNYNLISNCANYGTIAINHPHGSYHAYIGGIVGNLYASAITNCINFGEIRHYMVSASVAYNQMIGGLVGKSEYATVENCVNIGSISADENTNNVGSLVGYIDDHSDIRNCYWEKSSHPASYAGYKNSYRTTIEYVKPFDKDFIINETVSVGDYKGNSLIAALNAYSRYNMINYTSHWILNKDKKVVSFTVNDNITIPYTSQIILLPNFANIGEDSFDGWYTDEECTTLLVHYENNTDTAFYGIYGVITKIYTITFDTKGGSPVESISATYGTVVELPRNSFIENKVIAYWMTEGKTAVPFTFTMPSFNITLYAEWALANITSAEELIEFSETVNIYNVNYAGLTVKLANDIDFSGVKEQFFPIGNTTGRYFNGVFDGQGHTIFNLAIVTKHVGGLFGDSKGMTVKNVNIDKSCSIAVEIMGDYYTINVGGIVGNCYAEESDCVIENCTNSMNIVYPHDEYITMGGIAGVFVSYDYNASIRNCVNRGNIILAANPRYNTVSMGGIAGHAHKYGWSDNRKCSIQNSDNYGDIKIDGRPKETEIKIDGIVGCDPYNHVDIKGCTNYGKVSRFSAPGAGFIVGVVFGFILLAIVAVILVFVYRSLAF